MTQLTAADLAGMEPEAIEQARHAGRLDTLLGVPQAEQDVIAKARGDQRLSMDDVRHLSRLGHHDLITAANAAGRIDLAPDATPSRPTREAPPPIAGPPPQDWRPGYGIRF